MTDKPRCPLRMAGFDQPDTCDQNCAWLMEDTDEIGVHACAIAVIAMSTGKQRYENDSNSWVIENEVNDGKD